jgi:hypothetical protein
VEIGTEGTAVDAELSGNAVNALQIASRQERTSKLLTGSACLRPRGVCAA